jgi:hypothetical protein
MEGNDFNVYQSNQVGFDTPKNNPTDGERNFQEDIKRLEMNVVGMFGGIGMEAIGRIKEKPYFRELS